MVATVGTTAAVAPSAAAATDSTGAAGPASSATPADGAVKASSLKLRRKVDPEYPTRALQQGISGWVDLDFTVTRDGSVRDVTVAAADPADVFDNSASNAVRRWRYEPVLRDGQPVEQRTHVRLRYTAKDK